MRPSRTTLQVCFGRSAYEAHFAALLGDDAEWAALPTLISCRLAMSLTLGAVSAAHDPGDAYLRLTLAPGWRALQMMRATPAAEWEALLRADHAAP